MARGIRICRHACYLRPILIPTQTRHLPFQKNNRRFSTRSMILWNIHFSRKLISIQGTTKSEKLTKGTACGVALLVLGSPRRALIRWRQSALEQPQQPPASPARHVLSTSPRAELRQRNIRCSSMCAPGDGAHLAIMLEQMSARDECDARSLGASERASGVCSARSERKRRSVTPNHHIQSLRITIATFPSRRAVTTLAPLPLSRASA